MFHLTRTYSAASFIGMVIVAIVLSVYYHSLAVRSLIEHETSSNVAITQALSNALWPRYVELISRSNGNSPQELSFQPEIQNLRKEVLQNINGLRVMRVKIYDLNGMTVFSTDPSQIGESGSDNVGFQRARNGAINSDLEFRSQFSGPEKIIENRDLLSTYMPVRRTPDGDVEGVFEVYTDVTSLVEDIKRTEYTVFGGITLLLFVLYLFLLLIVRRADRIIKQHESTERKAQAEQIHYMANHDPLTTLPNRAMFKEKYCLAFTVAMRNHSPLGILFVDIDRFKVINDSLGHDGGDAVLVKTAKRIRECIQNGDMAFHLGGDEFTVILQDSQSIEDAAQKANKLLRKISKPMSIGDRKIVVTVSIGIAVFPGATKDAQRLLKDANVAMHEAKELGRNRCAFYTQEMSALAQQNLEFELGLHKALAKQEFIIHYQPRVNAALGTVTGVEALLRWQHPTHGLIMPEIFIPMLEDTGLITPVGEWALQQACAHCKRWHDNGHSLLRVSVNLSMKQFRGGSLLTSVRRALKKSGLPARFLELELTESVLVNDAEQALSLMNELKKIGVWISIDDFGTGYSSLNYLRHFPIDLLKIDRTFINEVTTNPGDAAITTTIAAMTQNLNIGMLAEGVETREQELFLRAIGCHEMQGSFFSKPVAEDQVSTVIGKLDVFFKLDEAKSSNNISVLGRSATG